MDETATLLSQREDLGATVSQAGAFESFYEQERDPLFGALCLITGDRHEAEEIAQDAFIAVWERWERVREMESPAGYLYRTALNGFRKRRRRAGLAVRRAVGLVPADDSFGAAETRHMIRTALASLSRRQRAAVVMTELLGFTSEEAATAMGIRAATVRVLASQGRTALARAMGRIDG